MSPSSGSLLEHLPLHDAEIERREALAEILPEDAAVLAACWPAVRDDANRLVKACVRRQLEAADIAAFVGGTTTPESMERDMSRFVRKVFCGRHDSDYASSRLRVGFVHRRIGLPARYFLAALHHLQVGLRRSIAAHLRDADAVGRTVAALERRLLFDESLIIDAYEHRLASEVAREHDRALRYASNLEAEVAARTHELEQLSRTDALTGLRNRRAFLDELGRELSRARRQERPLAALYVDLNEFKALNDNAGHARGDEALAGVAAALTATLRDIDVAARLGGDEFCVLLPDTDLRQAAMVAARLRERVRDTCPVTVSVGVAALQDGDHAHPESLIERADADMYRDKRRIHAPDAGRRVS